MDIRFIVADIDHRP